MILERTGAPRVGIGLGGFAAGEGGVEVHAVEEQEYAGHHPLLSRSRQVVGGFGSPRSASPRPRWRPRPQPPGFAPRGGHRETRRRLLAAPVPSAVRGNHLVRRPHQAPPAHHRPRDESSHWPGPLGEITARSAKRYSADERPVRSGSAWPAGSSEPSARAPANGRGACASGLMMDRCVHGDVHNGPLSSPAIADAR